MTLTIKHIKNTKINKIQYKLVPVSGMCCPSMLCVDGFVFCSISLVFVYKCVRMPSSPRTVAGVPSSWALPGFPITSHHLCAFLMLLEGYLCGGITTVTPEKRRGGTL